MRLRLGGRTRTDVSLSARDLNLGAAAGSFTSAIDVGTLELGAGGTFRVVGTRLVFP